MYTGPSVLPFSYFTLQIGHYRTIHRIQIQRLDYIHYYYLVLKVLSWYLYSFDLKELTKDDCLILITYWLSVCRTNKSWSTELLVTELLTDALYTSMLL